MDNSVREGKEEGATEDRTNFDFICDEEVDTIE